MQFSQPYISVLKQEGLAVAVVSSRYKAPLGLGQDEDDHNPIMINKWGKKKHWDTLSFPIHENRVHTGLWKAEAGAASPPMPSGTTVSAWSLLTHQLLVAQEAAQRLQVKSRHLGRTKSRLLWLY